MNGRVLADGKIETWPDNETAENILVQQDGSITKFDDAMGSVVWPASVLLEGTNDWRRVKRWGHQYREQFRERPSKGWRKHVRRTKSRA